MEGNILDLAISEIEKQKFSLHESKLPSTKVGLTDALGVLNYLKEEHFINCECGHSVEHKHSFTNEDGQVTCISCVNATLQAELEKAKELLKIIKDVERGLLFMQLPAEVREKLTTFLEAK